MNKSIRKRMKFTKSGKLLKRKAGQNHFNAKESRTAQRRKKRLASFSAGFGASIRKYAVRVTK